MPDTEDTLATLPRDTIRSYPEERRHPPKTVGEALTETEQGRVDTGSRYCVLGQLGRGGMGEVSRTFDVKIGREVALKSLLPVAPEVAAVATGRFLREAKVQALLEHPAVVPVYDIGTGADGLAFFTMKQIRGRTLWSLLEDLRRDRAAGATPRHSLRWLLVKFVTVCLAVHYAHERGVVHRDLKPENIMLGPHGEVYVLDWGVARVLHASDAQAAGPADSEPTRPGEMIGTPGFMPPEQILGVHAEVDARSDVFALGAILYEIVTQTSLFTGTDTIGLIEATLNPVRPRPPLVPDAPPELVELALRCTMFQRSARPAGADEIVQAIESYLDGDRDEALRRRMADDRATRAEEQRVVAMSGAAGEREAARSMAMQEAGRALALAPDHQRAAAVVLDLLRAPPDPPPAEALREVDALDTAHRAAAVRDNAIRIASWVVLAPVPFLMGVRTPWLAAAALSWLGGMMVLALWMWRTSVTTRAARLTLFACTCVFAALASSIFGPLVFVPAFVAMNTVVFGAQTTKNERRWQVALSCLAVVGPLALELTGAVPPSMRLDGSSIVLLPRVVEFEPAASLAFLTAVTLSGIVIPSIVTGRVRDALAAAERDLVVQKWQLAQLGSAPRRGG